MKKSTILLSTLVLGLSLMLMNIIRHTIPHTFPMIAISQAISHHLNHRQQNHRRRNHHLNHHQLNPHPLNHPNQPIHPNQLNHQNQLSHPNLPKKIIRSSILIMTKKPLMSSSQINYNRLTKKLTVVNPSLTTLGFGCISSAITTTNTTPLITK